MDQAGRAARRAAGAAAGFLRRSGKAPHAVDGGPARPTEVRKTGPVDTVAVAVAADGEYELGRCVVAREWPPVSWLAEPRRMDRCRTVCTAADGGNGSSSSQGGHAGLAIRAAAGWRRSPPGESNKGAT